MRLLTLCLLATLSATPALAAWTVAQDGAALIENGGDAALALSCDNNANTGGKPSWRLELTRTGLTQTPPRTELQFQFAGRKSLELTADHRLGKFVIDGMEQNSQKSLEQLLRQLKASNRVTVTFADNPQDEVSFSLKGSSKAIATAAKACQ